MPLYEHHCADCGPFTQLRSLDQSSEPAKCPECGALSAKVFSVINLRSMGAANRIAHQRNESSAHAPHACGSGCTHGHARPKPRAKSSGEKPALQFSTKANSRPWMLGH